MQLKYLSILTIDFSRDFVFRSFYACDTKFTYPLNKHMQSKFQQSNDKNVEQYRFNA